LVERVRKEMMQTQNAESLGQRLYNGHDQQRFAELSGDFNPLHLDPLIARREVFGDVVVHGIHAALGALSQYCRFLRSRGVEYLCLRTISARFPGPILLGQRIETFVTEATDGEAKLQSWHGDRLVLAVRIEWLSVAKNSRAAAPPSRPLIESEPRDVTFAALANRTGSLDLVLDPALAHELFPDLVQLISAVTVAELLAVTRLVGMECPGMRSVLSSVSLGETVGVRAEPVMTYKVIGTDDRFSLVRLAVTGPSLAGNINAFYRPSPIAQPTINEVAARLTGKNPAGEITAHCALIVGGSRGLGEVTAKIVAAAGGHAIITYQRGRDDAEKIVAEITAAGLRAEARRLDVDAPDGAVAELHSLGIRPTHVYYFASPKIFVTKEGMFDAEVLARFTRCYVEGLYNVYRACRRHWDYPLMIFYPSSVAIDQKNKDLVEYATAKVAGETLASHLVQFDPKLSVLIRRLPRTATDQTTTLMPFPAEDALEVMLAIMRDLPVWQAAADH
jgi:acyl dehydratase